MWFATLDRVHSHFELIDLSPIGRKPILKAKCLLLLSILDSIIASDGCSLKCITFPITWSGIRARLQAFQLRYNQLSEGRGLSCNCNTRMGGNGYDWSSFYNGRMVHKTISIATV